MHSRHKIQANIIVIITGSPKISWASEIHCDPSKLDLSWLDWPASEKVKHDPCMVHSYEPPSEYGVHEIEQVQEIKDIGVTVD